MSFLNKIIGPKSKYDKTIPFTYMAKVFSIEGDEETYETHFSDTICGLIDYLDDHDIDPENVKIFGIYQKKEIEFDIDYCTSSSGRWLERPKICQSLEAHYQETMDECYKGHTAEKECDYADRDRDAD